MENFLQRQFVLRPLTALVDIMIYIIFMDIQKLLQPTGKLNCNLHLDIFHNY